MKPNKKPKGFFMHPGLNGKTFNAEARKIVDRYTGKEFLPRFASMFVIGVVLGMAAAAASPIIGAVVFSLCLATAFTKAPVGILGTGPAPGVETEEEKAMKKIELKMKSLLDSEVKADRETILELKAQIESLKNPEQKDAIIKLQADLKALTEKGNGTGKQLSANFMTALNAALEEKKAEIQKIVEKGGRQEGSLTLEVKAAITMEMANTIEAAGSASHYSLTSNTGIISKIRKRILTYLESVSIGGLSVDRPYAMWIEELDEQGNPIFIGEGDDKTKLSVRYEEREKKARKIAVYGKVSTEMLKYLPQLISYIQNNMIRKMDIATEDQLFNGDNTGNNLAGLIPYATAFDGGVGVAGGPGLVGLVPNANEYDVIRAVALQVYNSYGIPSRIFILPDVLALMEVLKDSQGRYLLPPFATAGGKTISGVELIPTNALVATDYDFVGGDLSVVNCSFLEQTNIVIGLDGNDFTKNLKTMLVEQEVVQFVSANDTQVIVKGDMATAKALLEAVAIP